MTDREIRAVWATHRPQGKVELNYPGRVFHLAAAGEDRTLCKLHVVKGNGFGDGLAICSNCKRIREREHEK